MRQYMDNGNTRLVRLSFDELFFLTCSATVQARKTEWGAGGKIAKYGSFNEHVAFARDVPEKHQAC